MHTLAQSFSQEFSTDKITLITVQATRDHRNLTNNSNWNNQIYLICINKAFQFCKTFHLRTFQMQTFQLQTLQLQILIFTWIQSYILILIFYNLNNVRTIPKYHTNRNENFPREPENSVFVWFCGVFFFLLSLELDVGSRVIRYLSSALIFIQVFVLRMRCSDLLFPHCIRASQENSMGKCMSPGPKAKRLMRANPLKASARIYLSCLRQCPVLYTFEIIWIMIIRSEDFA